MRGPHFLFAAWVLSAMGTFGSLFFSEVMQFAPCTLCWYQRIFMYPLVVTLAVGYACQDPRVYRYSMPLVLLGLIVAVYHNLLFYGVIPASLAPCTQGVSCTEAQLEGFGFVSIPLLSLVGFVCLATLLQLFKNRGTSWALN
ncbi:MAG: disulfide bond formation protein B [Bdellovibrionaceae bacterium]|nr:disulfide bond formation protein B [Pseudobdellovibrionaceae bacterium]